MLTIFRWLCLGLVCVAMLIYVSALGVGISLGLMTWDLPAICKPLLQWQPFVWFSVALGLPISALIHFQTHRRLPIFLSLLAATIWVWCLPLLRVGWPLRRQGLQQSATRMSAAMVENLEKYRRKNGIYPANLNEVGGPIETGMVSYSHLTYRRADAQTPFSGYEIKIRTDYGLGFDSFFYWPSENYPARIYGGSTEIIAAPRHKWAYVHE